MTQEKHQFDLSDGFGKEDIYAILAGIWNFIAFLLKLFLFPYVWILRMLSRSVRFVKTKDASDNLLTEDEQMFMESTPTFFILFGFFVGVLVVLFVAVFGSDAVSDFLEKLSLDSLLETIEWWLLLFLEIILSIIGLDTTVDGVKTYRKYGIIDFFRVIFEILTEIFTSDPLLLFLGIGLVGIAIAVIWIVISETGIVSRLISIIVTVVSYIITTPGNIYSRTNRVYLAFNKRLSSIVIGTDRIQNNQKSFHKKILLYSLGLGIWTFLGGLFVLASQEFGDTTLQITFIMIVCIVFGLGVGIIEMFLIVRFLDIVSRGKYSEPEVG
jgi:hypothetical protein